MQWLIPVQSESLYLNLAFASLWHWATYLTFFCYSFHICEMWVLNVSTEWVSICISIVLSIQKDLNNMLIITIIIIIIIYLYAKKNSSPFKKVWGPVY